VSCSLVMARHTDVSEEPAASIFCAEYGGNRFLRNVGTHLRKYTALHLDIVVTTRNRTLYYGSNPLKNLPRPVIKYISHRCMCVCNSSPHIKSDIP
jgi:hypothetical protein